MAFFGPRPFLVSELSRIGAYADDLLSVTPGIVSHYGAFGRSRLTVEERARVDAKYARRCWKPWLKWHALVRTVYHCLKGPGAG
jgi:lipopolysaccharide/colanic/teichoic acid biosynthesis glycosyltransferase